MGVSIMKKRLKWLIPVLLIVLIVAVYIWPVSKPSFEKLYADVDKNVVDSLTAFRAANPTKTVDVNNAAWEYLVLGQGEETIVFIHGMYGTGT